MKTTANRGEWAELYALVRILLTNVVPSLDKDLNPIPGKLFKFLELLRKDDGTSLRFVPYDSPFDPLSSESLPERSDLEDVLDAFWQDIKSTKGSAFQSEQGLKLMRALGIKNIKAKSSEKVDLYARLAGLVGADDGHLGFSIKSQVGANSTLVNASAQTIFVYSVQGAEVDWQRINAIDTRSKIQDRVKEIYNCGGTLVFDSVSSNIFQENLDLIDSTLKKNLADLLVVAYKSDNRNLVDAITFMATESDGQQFEKRVTYQIKNFLRAAALGMVPGTEWDGELTAYGGYLIVKADGSIGCFHLQKDDDFKNYLLEHTKFDTPSGASGRAAFGALYEGPKGVMFSLKLQIRFL